MSMLRHVVVIRFRDDAPADARLDAIQKLWLLKDHPNAVNWSAGWNIFEDPKHDYALSCDFESREALMEYLGSPAHKVAAEALLRVMDGDRFSYVDYPVTDAPVPKPA
jgi:hypothetical protein